MKKKKDVREGEGDDFDNCFSWQGLETNKLKWRESVETLSFNSFREMGYGS